MRTRLCLALALILALAGCGFHGLYSVSLPGGADLGAKPYHVTVVFGDVLDLVPQSSVKVNDVTVGKVESIKLDGWKAKVTLAVNRDVHLPANSTAQLEQTSLLGEKYVALVAPPRGHGNLADGDTVKSSGRGVEVEEVLSALSLLLNGGGVTQLQTINRELGRALQGREGSLRNLLTQLDHFVGGLDAQRSEVVRALTSVNKLATTLDKQRKVLTTALDKIPPALKILADERGQLTKMLTALNRLGTVGVQVINGSKEATLADLKALQPTLTTLANAGSALPNSLELLLTYPFPENAPDDIRGDYTNLYVTADLDLHDVLHNLIDGPNTRTLQGGDGPTTDPSTGPSTAPSSGPSTAPTTTDPPKKKQQPIVPPLPPQVPRLPTIIGLPPVLGQILAGVDGS
ncbi:MAG TPA: MCE family protein [Mycobacteriales bacterium]|jgi:phospholipid/cholesterol/gamma-HCH transport system substrate-binding protein|nr:MCE family protein [Mycobacteriales bacterium]